MFLGASRVHTKITILINYISLPPLLVAFIYGVALTPEVQLIFLCLIYIFYYSAFLFVIKVRNFPPGLNFYTLECVTNRREICFFFLCYCSPCFVIRDTFYSGLTLKNFFFRDVKKCE